MRVPSSRIGRTVVPVVMSLLASAAARAGEHRVRANEVPPSVRAAIAKRYPRAAILGYVKETERGAVSYEVSLRLGGRATDVGVSPEGRILSQEDRIDRNDLPAEVSNALLAPAYRQGHIERIERIVEPDGNGAARFEILLRMAGRKLELTFEGDGRLAKEERLPGGH